MKDLGRELIKKHEGRRLFPYECSAGKLTIGYGRNLEDNGITDEEADYLLSNDLRRVRSELSMNFDWYLQLNDVRQAVVEDMLFNLGLVRFLGFKKFMKALEQQDYEEAAHQMLDSKWATQVASRADELAELMEKGYE